MPIPEAARPTARDTLIMVLSALAIAACSSAGDPGSTANQDASSTTATQPVALTPSESLERAVNEVIAAGSYELEVKIDLAVTNEPTETELEGWVDGADRELTMKVGEQSVVTRVSDGIATVERDAVITEVPLQEAGGPPSLAILTDLKQSTAVSPTEITGTLTAAALKATGFDIDGTAQVTIHLTTNGTLTGYTLTGTNGNCTVDAHISDIGDTFSG